MKTIRQTNWKFPKAPSESKWLGFWKQMQGYDTFWVLFKVCCFLENNHAIKSEMEHSDNINISWYYLKIFLCYEIFWQNVPALWNTLKDKISFCPQFQLKWKTHQEFCENNEKMTVRGTMVRSEVCNSWCFCLES